MHTRAAALIAALFVPFVLISPPAHALVAPFPGTAHELQSEFGEARIAGAPGGALLVTRPALRTVERHVGSDVEVLAREVAAHLIAYDPSTGGAVVTTNDQRIVRIADGTQTTVASGLYGLDGIDVDDAGRIFATHFRSRTELDDVVTRFDPDGTRTIVAEGLDYVTTLALDDDGDLLVAENTALHRFRDGVKTTIAGAVGQYCSPPNPCGDEGPARDARFNEITALDVTDDGSIYLAEHRSARVRVIRPDGVIHNLLGSYFQCVKRERFDCIPRQAARSPIQKVVSLTAEHGFYVVDQDDAGRWTRLLTVTDVSRAPSYAPQGYRMVASDGGVFTFGWSPFHGSTGDIPLASPIVAARSNGAGGYWFVAGDGGVFAFGDAGFFGSAAGATSSPVVDMDRTPTGRGYWVLERNGAVHAFGDAPFAGHARLLGPFAAIVGSVDGDGYALVAEDGRQYGLGDRPGGPVQDLPALNAPLVAAHRTASGDGLWMVASDGGVFTQGDAGFFGSTGAMRLNQPVLDLVPTPTEQGYWLIAADGGVFSFGDAEFHGSMGAVRLNRPVVAGMRGPDAS